MCAKSKFYFFSLRVFFTLLSEPWLHNTHLLVVVKGATLDEALVAEVALVELVAGVLAAVRVQGGRVGELGTAVGIGTAVRPRTRVHALVAAQSRQVQAVLAAHPAHVRRLLA